jgi:hypothetical protein
LQGLRLSRANLGMPAHRGSWISKLRAKSLGAGAPIVMSNKFTERIAWAALLCFMQASISAVAQESSAGQSARDASSISLAALPDSPGATSARLQPPIVMQSSSQQSPGAAAPAEEKPQPPASQSSSQAPLQKPEGTAAAEPTHAAGIAASQPAGVAVAPAKQHRARTIIIRTGALIGAGVAVGTVVALTMATSSKPPGAH